MFRKLPSGRKFYFALSTCFLLFITQIAVGQGTLEVIGNGTIIPGNSSNTPTSSDLTDFGSVSIGSNSMNTFVLDNIASTSGNPSFEVTNIVVSISGSTDFTPTSTNLGSLKGNGTPINHTITFTPTSTGLISATVTITFGNGTNSPYSFNIQGTGTPALPEIEIQDSSNNSITSGSNFDFGTITPNSTASEDFTIHNTGNGSTTLNLEGINPDYVTISGDTEFNISVQPSSNTITGGNSESFTVEFNPTTIGGPYNAVISIDNDDVNGAEDPYIINLTGISDNITYVPTTSGPDWNVSNISSGIFDISAMVYGPDGFLWITEETGNVWKVDPVNGGAAVNMLDISSLVTKNHSQNGLLGIAVHPALFVDVTTTTNNYVYLAYTYTSGGLFVRIERYTYNYNGGNGFLDFASRTTVLEGFEGSSTGHSGGKLVIGPPNVPIADQKLFYSIGDHEKNRGGNACNEIRSLYLPTHNADYGEYEGKILRMNLDGSIPSDNPTLTSVQSHVYSYGHRNPQGIVFSSDGILYSSEHGDKTDDEINIISSGMNYGWPAIAGYNDDMGYGYCNWSAYPANCGSYDPNSCPGPYVAESDSSNASLLANFEAPIGTYNSTTGTEPTGGWLEWPTVAPSSINIYEGGLIPDWDKSLLIPTLKRGVIFRAKLDGTGNALESQVYEEFHSAPNTRYRDIAMDPDGITMYTATDNGDIIKIAYSGTVLSTDNTVYSNKNIKLVPNPANTYFKIVASNNQNEVSRVNILDFNGRLVKSLNFETRIFNVEDLSNGLYFIQLIDANNSTITTKKLLKK